MTDDDREHIEQLAEAIGECLAAIASLRADLAGVAEAQRANSAALAVHGHELAKLTAALERLDIGKPLHS